MSTRFTLAKFRLVYHDGKGFQFGPTTDLYINSTDTADTITCRVLKVFQMPGTTHELMQFTAPKLGGVRIVPNFYGVKGQPEVYVHVRTRYKDGFNIIQAGVKRMGLISEDDAAHDLKRLKL